MEDAREGGAAVTGEGKGRWRVVKGETEGTTGVRAPY